MEPAGAFACSQEPCTENCPEPRESSRQLHNLLILELIDVKLCLRFGLYHAHRNPLNFVILKIFFFQSPVILVLCLLGCPFICGITGGVWVVPLVQNKLRDP